MEQDDRLEMQMQFCHHPAPTALVFSHHIEDTALFIIARTWKQPRCPSADEWIRKLWYIRTMEYYSAIKKNPFESVLMRHQGSPMFVRDDGRQWEESSPTSRWPIQEA